MLKYDGIFIRIDPKMPEHPKVEALSDGAFRLLVNLWCYSHRYLTDGRLSSDTWAKRGKARLRKELVDAGLVEIAADGTGVVLHDYLDHQMSREEVLAAKQAHSIGGSVGNHNRWHKAKKKRVAGCLYCDADAISEATPDRSVDRSEERSLDRSQTDRKRIADIDTDTEEEPKGSSSRPRNVRGTRIPDDFKITPEMAAWSQQRQFRREWVISQTERFINYWRAKSGKDATKRDWVATWRNWLLEGADRAPAAAREAAPWAS